MLDVVVAVEGPVNVTVAPLAPAPLIVPVKVEYLCGGRERDSAICSVNCDRLAGRSEYKARLADGHGVGSIHQGREGECA